MWVAYASSIQASRPSFKRGKFWAEQPCSALLLNLYHKLGSPFIVRTMGDFKSLPKTLAGGKVEGVLEIPVTKEVDEKLMIVPLIHAVDKKILVKVLAIRLGNIVSQDRSQQRYYMEKLLEQPNVIQFLELLSKFHNENPTIPIIILTTIEHSEVIELLAKHLQK